MKILGMSPKLHRIRYLFGCRPRNLTKIFALDIHLILHIQFELPLQGNGHFGIVTEGVALGYGVQRPFRPSVCIALTGLRTFWPRTLGALRVGRSH